MKNVMLASALSVALVVGYPQFHVAFADAVPRQNSPQSAFDSGRAWEHLRQMVLIGPRPAGSEALAETRTYICHQLKVLGTKCEEQTWVALTPIGNVRMTNLVATLPGRIQDRVLITGHYDTKRIQEFRFVGASDGASSAAMLIELLRVLSRQPREFTYEFVWFDGEEAFCKGWDDCSRPGAPDNTYGSRHYVESAKLNKSLSRIKAMILIDMVGAKDLKLRKDTSFSADWMNEIFWSTAKRMGHGNVFIDLNGDIGGDDHEPFSKAGIPTIDLIDLHDYYEFWHTKNDDLEHVSARSLQIVGDVLLAALPAVEQRLKKAPRRP